MEPTERLVILKGLESTVRADTLTRSQTLLAPYTDQIVTFWTAAWVASLTYLVLRYLLVPSWFEQSK
jgi:hypothetical protein